MNKIVTRPIFWITFCSLMFFTPIVRSIIRKLPEVPPALYSLPDFHLVDENGRDVTKTDFYGKIVIFNFIFTSCPSSCLKLTQEMQLIQKRVRGLGQKIQLVSLTVDPKTDDSAVLHKYARSFHANPFIWKFLTGEENDIEKLIRVGFRLVFEKQKESKNFAIPQEESIKEEISYFDIAHSEKFVLLDQKGMIRSYYSADKQGINRMMVDVGLLVNSKI
jgi:protein SCO1/2